MVSEPNGGWSWDGVRLPPQNPGEQGGPPPSPPPMPWQSYAEQQRALTGGNAPAPYGAIAHRPGIIALRPLTFGEFFDGAFRAIQHNPRVMFGLSLLVAVVLGLLQALAFAPLLGELADPAFVEQSLDTAGLGALMGMTAATALVTGLATVVLNGLLVVSVSQSILGRRASVRAVWDRAKRQLLRLIGLTLITGLIEAVVIAGVVLGAVVLLGGVALVDDGGGLGSLVGALVVLSLLAVGAGVLILFFYVKFSLGAPALMMEGAGVFRSLARSWELTRGFFWRNLGVLVVSSMIASALSGLVSFPIGLFASGISSASANLLPLATVAGTLLGSLVTALITPFLAAVTALLYVDIRMRKEALDVELIRAVDAPI